MKRNPIEKIVLGMIVIVIVLVYGGLALLMKFGG